ncbi:hypothetical protein RF11_08174 [Thelohanellus kitauei]|uniref:C2 domain-containing protein n=1 Tax=Thelohanellus kitauei TaxID=669202 RepID=A0A0C2JUF0_THEKT|nr:hypothetical protein RF11_08174 [Thelohanellus kitauei]
MSIDECLFDCMDLGLDELILVGFNFHVAYIVKPSYMKMTVNVTYKNKRKSSNVGSWNEQIVFHLKYHSDNCKNSLMISNDNYHGYEKIFYAEFNILDVFYGIEESCLVEVDDERYKFKQGDFHIKHPAFLIEYTHDNITIEKVFMGEYVYEQQKGVKIYESINEREDSLNECKPILDIILKTIQETIHENLRVLQPERHYSSF